ncbi:reverse transcriptase domain-containing protein [Tanacetum coccineum]
MEEYIRLEEEKSQRHGRTFNWQTATFGKVKNYEDEDDHPIDFKTEFPAIVFDNTLTAIQSEPTICPLNENELDFRISLDKSDDEDYTVSEALKHPEWVDAMQEELNQFYRNKVWTLVPLPHGKTAIGSKWHPSFESSEFPNYVCKVDKALYGLKQSPTTW